LRLSRYLALQSSFQPLRLTRPARHHRTKPALAIDLLRRPVGLNG
jgi:hypothetical protein